jgi:hypothetical protein
MRRRAFGCHISPLLTVAPMSAFDVGTFRLNAVWPSGSISIFIDNS